MLGSSNSIACANIMLNAAVAQSLKIYADHLECAQDFDGELHLLLRQTIAAHQRIIFNGNGYDDAWIHEATEERGLLNLRTTADAMPTLLKPKNVAMLTGLKVMTAAEIQSRYDITLDNYCKAVNIEGRTMVDMARREILPAVEAYAQSLAAALSAKTAAVPALPCSYEKSRIAKLSTLTDAISSAADELDSILREVHAFDDVTRASCAMRDRVLPQMSRLRAVCDEAETLTARSFWPFPTYDDLLFGLE